VPGDNVTEGNVFDYPLKNLFRGSCLANCRLGALVDGEWSVFQNTYAVQAIPNSVSQMISAGPAIHFEKGEFVLWFYEASNMATRNYYAVNQVYILFYYSFNL
jgi:hypothetical protein